MLATHRIHCDLVLGPVLGHGLHAEHVSQLGLVEGYGGVVRSRAVKVCVIYAPFSVVQVH